MIIAQVTRDISHGSWRPVETCMYPPLREKHHSCGKNAVVQDESLRKAQAFTVEQDRDSRLLRPAVYFHHRHDPSPMRTILYKADRHCEPHRAEANALSFSTPCRLCSAVIQGEFHCCSEGISDAVLCSCSTASNRSCIQYPHRCCVSSWL